MGKHTPVPEQRRLVEVWRGTTESKATFARAHGVRPGTFSLWVSKHPAVRRLAAEVPQFVQVPRAAVPAPPTAVPAPRAFGVQVGDHALRFDAPPPPSWFAAVLQELSSC